MKTCYLDHAATSLTPEPVIEAMDSYYRGYRAGVHRGLYKEAERATLAFEDARAKLAAFIGAAPEEVVFTSGATASLNMVASRLGETLGPGDEVLLTEMEHHANIVPWQEAARRRGFVLKRVPVTPDFELDMEAYRALLTEKTKVVAVAHVSNVLGTVNPVAEMARLAREKGALVVVDAAQSVPHMKVNVRELGADFLAFSGHKMLGPTGIGVLYGKRERLAALEPFLYGGHMIRAVTKEGAEWADAPAKFEAGTPNIAGAIGLGAAVDELGRLGMDEVERHSRALARLAAEKLAAQGGVRVLAHRGALGIVSFAVDGMHPHDVSELLAREGVAVRAGHHCAMPLMAALGVNGAARASFHVSNTEADVERLADAVKKAQEVFKG